MICYFCNSALQDTAPAGDLKEVFLLYVCNKCQPHEVLYRELYDQETKLNQFEPMPVHSLFYMLLFEAPLPENYLEPILNYILQAFVNVYKCLNKK